MDEMIAGDALELKGDLAGALQDYRDSLASVDSSIALETSNTTARYKRVLLCRKLGRVLLKTGDYSGALRSYQDSLAANRWLASTFPDQVRWRAQLPTSLIHLGDVLLDQGEIIDALRSFEEALSISSLLGDKDATSLGRQSELSLCHERISVCLQTASTLRSDTARILIQFVFMIPCGQLGIRSGLAMCRETNVDSDWMAISMVSSRSPVGPRRVGRRRCKR